MNPEDLKYNELTEARGWSTDYIFQYYHFYNLVFSEKNTYKRSAVFFPFLKETLNLKDINRAASELDLVPPLFLENVSYLGFQTIAEFYGMDVKALENQQIEDRMEN